MSELAALRQLVQRQAREPLNKRDGQVLAAIALETVCNGKTNAALTGQQLAATTGIERRHVSASLGRLTKKGWLHRDKSKGGQTPTVSLNITHETAPHAPLPEHTSATHGTLRQPAAEEHAHDGKPARTQKADAWTLQQAERLVRAIAAERDPAPLRWREQALRERLTQLYPSLSAGELERLLGVWREAVPRRGVPLRSV